MEKGSQSFIIKNKANPNGDFIVMYNDESSANTDDNVVMEEIVESINTPITEFDSMTPKKAHPSKTKKAMKTKRQNFEEEDVINKSDDENLDIIQQSLEEISSVKKQKTKGRPRKCMGRNQKVKEGNRNIVIGQDGIRYAIHSRSKKRVRDPQKSYKRVFIEDVMEILEGLLPPFIRICLEFQLTKFRKVNVHHLFEMKKLAVTLFTHFGKTHYSMLSSMMTLPSISMVKRYSENPMFKADLDFFKLEKDVKKDLKILSKNLKDAEDKKTEYRYIHVPQSDEDLSDCFVDEDENLPQVNPDEFRAMNWLDGDLEDESFNESDEDYSCEEDIIVQFDLPSENNYVKSDQNNMVNPYQKIEPENKTIFHDISGNNYINNDSRTITHSSGTNYIEPVQNNANEIPIIQGNMDIIDDFIAESDESEYLEELPDNDNASSFIIDDSATHVSMPDLTKDEFEEGSHSSIKRQGYSNLSTISNKPRSHRSPKRARYKPEDHVNVTQYYHL